MPKPGELCTGQVPSLRDQELIWWFQSMQNRWGHCDIIPRMDVKLSKITSFFDFDVTGSKIQPHNWKDLKAELVQTEEIQNSSGLWCFFLPHLTHNKPLNSCRCRFPFSPSCIRQACGDLAYLSQALGESGCRSSAWWFNTLTEGLDPKKPWVGNL